MIDYKQFVDSVKMACCVISVEKKGDSYGAIKIICSNQKYKEIMGPKYYDGMPYYELVPEDNKFEDFCYRAAVLGQRMHAYVETTALGYWTDQTLIPLQSEDEGIGYCQFIFEFTKGADSERMASVSINTAETIIKSCIELMGTDDFDRSVENVLRTILEKSEAAAGRIMLVDHDRRKAIKYCEVLADGFWPDYVINGDAEDVITYDLMVTWEEIIGVSNAVIIQNESDMDELENQDPIWVRSMRESGVTSLILIPLRRGKNVIGYLYVVNFNTKNIVDIKEMIELISFFLGSEISNNLLMKKLEEISSMDALTGLNNRRAMVKRMKMLSVQRRRVPFGIVNIDLNGLKTVNDRDGHEAGDIMLMRAGELMKKRFFSEDIFRTGGDEFLIIIPDIDKASFMENVAKLKKDAIGDDLVSLAIGEYWSDGTDDIKTSFQIADDRMYKDKMDYYEKHPEYKR